MNDWLLFLGSKKCSFNLVHRTEKLENREFHHYILLIAEKARVKGFALDGEGLLEAATIEIKDYCADGSDCTTEKKDEATERKYVICAFF
jgi:hypothetical protein